MKLVLYHGEYMVIDSAKRVVRLTKKLETPSDIFTAAWVMQDDEKTVTDAIELTAEAKSLKGLKHYVAGYIISNALPFAVPTRYIKAYERYVEANKGRIK